MSLTKCATKAPLFLLIAASLFAEEGMWRFDQAPLDVIRQSYGVELTEAELARVERAAVRILAGGGAGTGTFASANGLILTNHHVALDCIRTSSLADEGEAENFVDNGFTAENQAAELACKRFVAQVERESRDVTAELDAVQADGMTASAIQQARQAKRSQLERDCQAQHGANFSCSVQELNSGATSLLIVYEEFRDIRLVYAPKNSSGFSAATR